MSPPISPRTIGRPRSPARWALAGVPPTPSQSGREHLVVVGRVDAEQLERLKEGAAPGDDLRPTLADQVQGGEVLVQPDRVQSGQDRYSAGEPDTAGGLGDGGQDDRRRGDGELGAVMLAQGENVQTSLVSRDAVRHDLPDARARVVEPAGGRVGLAVRQGQDAQFHGDASWQ
jgi:hypothetical protein